MDYDFLGSRRLETSGEVLQLIHGQILSRDPAWLLRSRDGRLRESKESRRNGSLSPLMESPYPDREWIRPPKANSVVPILQCLAWRGSGEAPPSFETLARRLLTG